MKKHLSRFILISTALLFYITQNVAAQQNLTQDVYAIIEQSCLICHGENGSYRESLIIEHKALIENGKIIPGDPESSVFYQRLIETDVATRMPLGQPPLTSAAIETIRQWIAAGAPDWNTPVRANTDFITPQAMLETIEAHVQSIPPFDRTFARYFTSTHLYNAGESDEALKAYQRALSKLVNSLSWGREIVKPKAIDPIGTIFYIDLRDYQWEVGTNRWTQIERIYPYTDEYNAPSETSLHEKLTSLQEELNCQVPFIHVDWFVANASLPPLYHDILQLPLTERELEEKLEVSVKENIQNAPGKRVWRAGFNDSGVSNHNRVVERHTFQHGAYWKSYDFAGSVGTQNIFTHPISFEHDGSEIIFNLPNGLQAYYLANQNGNRLNVAPTDIVSNPAVSDPAVRNGLSCIGCHTEGMKQFEDEVRNVVEQNANPPYDKARALSLYVEKATMDALLAQDTERYRQALQKTGDVFGGIEPIQRFHEVFQGPIDSIHAAASLGLQTEILIKNIQQNVGLQNLGLLVLENGTIKRDTWTQQWTDIVHALDFPQESIVTPVEPIPERIPGTIVNIPNPTLRTAIEEALGKPSGTPITVDDMAILTTLHGGGQPPQDLEGIQFATNLEKLSFSHGINDLSPLARLTNLKYLSISGYPLDLSPLAGLTNLEYLNIGGQDFGVTSDTGQLNNVGFDISALAGLTKLHTLRLLGKRVYDISPLVGLTELQWLDLGNLNPGGNRISDISPLAGLTELQRLNLTGNPISDISPLSGLINLERLYLGEMHHEVVGGGNNFSTAQGVLSDISPLVGLTKLQSLSLNNNKISDISSLSSLINLERLDLRFNNISEVSPLANLQKLSGTLNLLGNNISEVSPLANLENLLALQLQFNKISNISPLDGLPEKTRVFWYGNPGFPKGGPKIEGPWLWVLLRNLHVPHDVFILEGRNAVFWGRNVVSWRNYDYYDYLSEASDGSVTEQTIAADGATEGNSVGEHVWTSHKINPTNTDKFGDKGNIWEMLSTIGIKCLNCSGNVIYGLTYLYSPREQKTNMFAGSSAGHKVWLNGELVRNWHVRNRIYDLYTDYEDAFPVTLKQGQNVLLVAVNHGYGNTGRWRFSGDFGFAPGTEYTTYIPGVEYSLSDPTIYVGDTFTLDIRAEDVHDLADWQFDISFNPNVLEVLEVNEGDFMKQNGGSTYFQKGIIDNAAGKIEGLSSAILTDTGVNGTGVLLSVTFKAKTEVETQVALHNFQLLTILEETIPAGPHKFIFAITPKKKPLTGDVNRDGQVNIRDMILVSRSFGKDASDNPEADVNQDGTINIQDLILVAQHLGETTDNSAAPTILAKETEQLTPAIIQNWIKQAQIEDDGSLAFQQGIEYLQQLLASLLPEKTILLPNYPNPFNPETWIPYQLATPADVSISIYAADGQVVRTLQLGNLPAGHYTSRSRAAHWDGKNKIGESVASGLYYYTLSADEFSATRRMLILK